MSGLSLVELLVGIALGLFVVAGAATLVAGQLSDTRRLVLEAQVQQDLRTTADIMTREIRRAGYWVDADQMVWAPGAPSAHYFDAPASTAAHVDISLLRNAGQVTGPVLGFRRDLASNGSGVLKLIDSAGHAQELTDPLTLDVQTFTVDIRVVSSSPLACLKDCAGGGQACWPTVEVREAQLSITGQSVTDSSVKRTVYSNVRLRNDHIVDNLNTATTGSSPFNVTNSPLCPS